MIIYLADRKMQILGQASSHLPEGLVLFNDKKEEDVETGVASFECTLLFSTESRSKVEEMAAVGNYILRQHNGIGEYYTIIDSDIDVKKRTIDIYGEDAGLDLLNDVAQKFEATDAYPIAWYINKWIDDSGFKIGINEIPSLKRKLNWDGEETVTKRLDSIATQFDNAEIGYSFKINNLRVTDKYINIYKKKGKKSGEQLRTNKNLNNITVKSSIANLATALYVTGGTPEGKDAPITLSGYKYDDGDFYVSGKYLKSRKALSKWSRHLSEGGNGEGHIEKTFSYDTISQSELCNRAVTELKKLCKPEVNYEVDISELPENIRIGDWIDLVDNEGRIYLSARVLKFEISVSNGIQKATLGEYLIKDDGINESVRSLAAQFAQLAKNRVFYTWVVYADDSQGNGISLEPDGKKYIGISTNRSKADPDLSDPSAYKWSKVEGDAGSSLLDIVEHYLVSDKSDGITIQTPGWGTAIPAMTHEKRYLWNYETFTYSNGDEDDTEPKIIGVYGDKGDAAPAIVSMVQQYILSDSDVEISGSGAWSPNLPEWQCGKYLWSRWATTWSVANPTPMTYSDPVLNKTWNEIHQTADDAKTNADDAKAAADAVNAEVSKIGNELASANAEIQSLADNLETVSNEMVANYAKKTELTSVEATLGTRIDQNAAAITSTASKVTEIETNANQALDDAEAAKSAAELAKQNAIEAQNKYTQLQAQADATDEQLEAAKQAVEKAQADATAAGDAAAAAQSAAGGLANRVTTAETKINQNAENISLTANKVDNIRIGGRNYILDSMDERESDEAKIWQYRLSEPWVAGEAYTLSFKGEKETGLFAVFFDDGITVLNSDIPFNEATGRYEYTFVCPEITGEEKDILAIYVLPADGGGGSVSLAKLEKGTRATDWTPAPEDGVDYTNDAIADATTKILQTAEDVTIGIMSGYTKSSDFERYKEEIENLFKASEDGFVFEFNQLSERISAASNEIVQRNQFIRLEEGNIVIGKSDSPVQARFTNDALEFTYSNQTVARFTNEVLEVENISVSNQVRFGSEWAIRPGQYIAGKGSNLDDVWIGG